MASMYRLLHKFTKRLRGDLEDTYTFVMFSLPLALVTIWFGIDTYELIHTQMTVYGAAQAAAVSAASQSQYTATTSVGGTGFVDAVNSNVAKYIADQTFSKEQSILNLSDVADIESTKLTFPSQTTAEYTVVVSYTPTGLFAALDILGQLFDKGHVSLTAPPITWTIAATAKTSGQSA